jgi:hypothetical protein
MARRMSAHDKAVDMANLRKGMKKRGRKGGRKR